MPMELTTGQKQVEITHYEFTNYVNKERWNSFYYQIKEILSIKPNSLLEIGVGSGILGTILKKIGCPYESMDIDSELHPDHTGSVLQMPFSDKTYDAVACFQVLEHLPFENFETSLSELFRVARKAVIISLPDSRRIWKYSIYIPKLGCKNILLPRPFAKKEKAVFTGEHYWEINKEGFEIKTIRSTIESLAKRHAFVLKEDYSVWENPYHHFFIMSPPPPPPGRGGGSRESD
jgi:ubiquinone/menaquinone biosynthesis C-methylase UbiE